MLDQEKAYDKISHEYLWTMLRRFNIPESFIQSVKTLYNSAETRVMINGFLSEPYQITRGVRQGDPLSCLLFDLAIEPLAASLRASNLAGYNIPGADERLIATLFADDTTNLLEERGLLRGPDANTRQVVRRIRCEIQQRKDRDYTDRNTALPRRANTHTKTNTREQ